MILADRVSEIKDLREALPPWTLVHILRGRADE